MKEYNLTYNLISCIWIACEMHCIKMKGFCMCVCMFLSLLINETCNYAVNYFRLWKYFENISINARCSSTITDYSFRFILLSISHHMHCLSFVYISLCLPPYFAIFLYLSTLLKDTIIFSLHSLFREIILN